MYRKTKECPGLHVSSRIHMRKTQIPQAFITTMKTGKRTVLKDKINLAIFTFWTKHKSY